jgi:hypothetical protein
MGKLNVFISYAHKDADYFKVFSEGLKTQLFTSSKFNFGAWEDSKIHIGSFWDDAIKENVKKADVAVLCVSGNFLNSKYIKEEEFKLLLDQYRDTYIFPVYFNHCKMEAWRDLSAIQFFKPSGSKYEKPNMDDFAFCDLVKFTETNKEYIPNSKIDLYIMDFVNQIETALSGGIEQPAKNKAELEKVQPAYLNRSQEVQEPEKAISLEKIVALIITSAIAVSLVLILYFLFKQEDTNRFKVNVSMGMFFGSLAAFMFNKKNAQLNRQ